MLKNITVKYTLKEHPVTWEYQPKATRPRSILVKVLDLNKQKERNHWESNQKNMYFIRASKLPSDFLTKMFYAGRHGTTYIRCEIK